MSARASAAPIVFSALTAVLIAAAQSRLSLALALVAAFCLTLIPQFRSLSDAVLGLSASRVPAGLSARPQEHTGKPRAGKISPRDGAAELSVPKAVAEPLERLLTLIVRDFVQWWYQPLSLGDDRFLSETRCVLYGFVNSLSARLGRLDHNESAALVIQSLSTALVREMRDQKEEEGLDEAARKQKVEGDKARLVRKLRDMSTELLFTFAPTSTMASPAVAALLAELLTSQLLTTTVSIDGDWINQTLVGFFDTAPAVELVAELQREENPVDAAPELVNLRDDDLAVPPTIRALAHNVLEALAQGDEPGAAALVDKLKKTCTGQSIIPLTEQWQDILDSFRNPNHRKAEALSAYLAKSEPAVKHRGDVLCRSLAVLLAVERLHASISTVSAESRQEDCYSALRRASQILASDFTPDEFEQSLSLAICARSVEALRNWIIWHIELDIWPAFVAHTPPSSQSPPPIDQKTPSRLLSTDYSPTYRERSASSTLIPHTISVAVTDLSARTAYDAQGFVRNKRELSFLCQVEATGENGFVIQRSQANFEKLEAGLIRAFPEAGTPAFPRALLPSTQHRNSDSLCQGYSAYLETLLSDSRYAASAPVATFFEREKTLGDRQSSALSFLDDLAQNATEGLVKTGELASRGVADSFGTMASIVSSPFNAILAERKSFSIPTTLAYEPRQSRPHPPLLDAGPSSQTSTPSKVAVLPPASGSKLLHSASPFGDSPARPPKGTALAEDSLLNQARDAPMASAAPIAPSMPIATASLVSDVPTDRLPLSTEQLNAIVVSAMTLLESAYDISEGEWSFRRGLIRIIEGVVRTTGLYRLEVLLADHLSALDETTVAKRLDEFRASFWPGDIWHASRGEVPPVRSELEKRATAIKAGKHVVALTPVQLKVALGVAASNEAFLRIHRALASSTSFRVNAAVLLDICRLLIL